MSTPSAALKHTFSILQQSFFSKMLRAWTGVRSSVNHTSDSMKAEAVCSLVSAASPGSRNVSETGVGSGVEKQWDAPAEPCGGVLFPSLRGVWNKM